MKTIILILLATVSIASALPQKLIGSFGFTGDFTLNHLYDFNNPGAQPFGTFSEQTVIWRTGIFEPFINLGQTIGGQELWTEGNLPLFSIGGFTITTHPHSVLINGPDSERFVLGYSDVEGNGYSLDSDHAWWTFFAPPYDISNFHEDITGPVRLQVVAFADTPDTGSTLALMGIGLLGMFFYARRIRVRT